MFFVFVYFNCVGNRYCRKNNNLNCVNFYIFLRNKLGLIFYLIFFLGRNIVDYKLDWFYFFVKFLIYNEIIIFIFFFLSLLSKVCNLEVFKIWRYFGKYYVKFIFFVVIEIL